MTPRTRFRKLESERRERILSSAAREFADRGYAGASLRRIIDRAGISKGTLYYYFEDKEDLFATALEHASRRLLEDVEMPDLASLDAGDFWDAFRALTRRSTEYVEEHEWYVRLARSFHRFRTGNRTSKVVERIDDLGRRHLVAFLERGRELGVVRSDLPLALLVEMTRAVDDAGDRWLAERWEELAEEDRARIVEARLDALRDMLDARNEGWER